MPDQRSQPAGRLYQSILRDAYDRLPAQIQAIHNVTTSVEASGRASVKGGSNLIARTIARAFRFPTPADDVRIHVRLARENNLEHWTRTFGQKQFRSTQEIGQGRNAGLLVERFGPFAFGLALTAKGNELHLIVRRWSVFGVPMPLRIAPWSKSYECVENDRFTFSVDIGLPLVGRLVHYRGWLEPDIQTS
ncbi:MAG: DUF4166 domain-containing protein [Hyphomicrobiaceae bacterium]